MTLSSNTRDEALEEAARRIETMANDYRNPRTPGMSEYQAIIVTATLVALHTATCAIRSLKSKPEQENENG